MDDRRSPFRSAAFRFALVFAAVFALAAFLLLAMVHHQVDRYAYKAMAGSLRSEAATLAAEEPGALRGEIARRMTAAPDGNFQYLLVDPAGRRLIGTVPDTAAHSGWGEVLMREHPPTPNDPERPERLMTFGTRLADASLLVVATDGYDIEKLGGHVIGFTVTWAGAITLLALIGGWLAGRVFLARLAAANGAIERIMTGRTEQRLPMIGLAPELDELARNLNRMLDRIDGLMDGLRQVSTDVAHDLRTPLTRLRQTLEAAYDTDDLGTMRTSIETALTQIDRLLATFRAILRLAQIEAGGRRVPFAPVALGGLISGLIETYEPVAADADHSLTAPTLVPTDAMVMGDGELLAQLFANLIENAIIHTPAGTRVDVRIGDDTGTLIVSICDDGPGVVDDQRQRITDRFYQVDPSRSGGGAGLGLALASAIAHLHEANLVISDAEPGLRIDIVFPVATG